MAVPVIISVVRVRDKITPVTVLICSVIRHFRCPGMDTGIVIIAVSLIFCMAVPVIICIVRVRDKITSVTVLVCSVIRCLCRAGMDTGITVVAIPLIFCVTVPVIINVVLIFSTRAARHSDVYSP